jgi:hypothetical protein
MAPPPFSGSYLPGMRTNLRTDWRRIAVRYPAAGLLFSALAACTSFSEGAPGPEHGAATSFAGTSGPAGTTAAPSGNEAGTVSGQGTGRGSDGGFVVAQMNVVGWPGASSSVVLSGHGATAQINGTDVQLQAAGNGRVTLLVAGRPVDCTAGQTIAAGRFEIRCVSTAEDSVTLTITFP